MRYLSSNKFSSSDHFLAIFDHFWQFSERRWRVKMTKFSKNLFFPLFLTYNHSDFHLYLCKSWLWHPPNSPLLLPMFSSCLPWQPIKVGSAQNRFNGAIKSVKGKQPFVTKPDKLSGKTWPPHNQQDKYSRSWLRGCKCKKFLSQCFRAICLY